MRHTFIVSALACNSLATWCHCVWMIKWLKAAKRTCRNSFEVHSCAHISCIWSIMRDLLVTVTCDRLIRLQITGLMERSPSGIQRRDIVVRGCSRNLSIKTGCIMADLFMVLMYLRRAHLSVTMYTWLERMEISCGVNVTSLPVIPLSFSLSVAPSSGIFLRLYTQSDRELVLRKVLGSSSSSSISVRWQRANLKRESVSWSSALD